MFFFEILLLTHSDYLYKLICLHPLTKILLIKLRAPNDGLSAVGKTEKQKLVSLLGGIIKIITFLF